MDSNVELLADEEAADRRAALQDRVLEVLGSHEFRSRTNNFDRRSLIQRANSLGGPKMKLLHWRKLNELRRIPRSHEAHTVDALDGIKRFGPDKVEIIMTSHRWLRPSVDSALSHADSLNDEKARAINEFSRWRRRWVRQRHRFDPEIYYWIDYSCVDQDNAMEAVPLLPLWVACCERFLRIETADYDERTWCRLEPLLSHVFAFADHHVSIRLDFRFRWPHLGEPVNRPILDPREGKLTNESDMAMVLPLIDAALRSHAVGGRQVDFEGTKSSVKCYCL